MRMLWGRKPADTIAIMVRPNVLLALALVLPLGTLGAACGDSKGETTEEPSTTSTETETETDASSTTDDTTTTTATTTGTTTLTGNGGLNPCEVAEESLQMIFQGCGLMTTPKEYPDCDEETQMFKECELACTQMFSCDAFNGNDPGAADAYNTCTSDCLPGLEDGEEVLLIREFH